MKKLLNVESFGGIDADTDTLLIDCFQDHLAYINAISHQKPLVLGRKGSGKTAIYKKIVNTKEHNVFAYGHTAYSGDCFHSFRSGVSTCSGLAFPPGRSEATLS